MKRLPASAICGFQLVPRVRKRLLELGVRVSLSDLRKHIQAACATEPLASTATTIYEKESLIRAYSQFITTAEDGHRLGRAGSEKLAWIIPDSHLTPTMELDLPTVDKIAELGFATQLGNDYQSWLPWVSLGIANLFRRWRQPRIRTIRRAIFKFKADANLPCELGRTTWPQHLPMQALYRHEPSQLLKEALDAFANLGLKSVNDLRRCCHPDAVLASKAKERPLFVLYRVLGQEDSSA